VDTTQLIQQQQKNMMELLGQAGGNMDTARRLLAGAGTQTAGLGFGGYIGPASNATEEYDGSTWTAGGNLNTARERLAGAGTQSAGLGFGGQTAGLTFVANTEEYNGSAWTNSTNMGTATRSLAGAGIQTAALGFGGTTGAITTATEEYNFSSLINVPAAWASGGV
jgi:hypothetical protein